MRANKRGFTLVELMIVVAIIGVLAALAIFGVRRYLASAKTSEAKNNVGAIARGAQGAFERESAASQLLGEGGTSTVTSHALCGSSPRTPGFIPAGTKYQPNTASGNDFESGDASNGWKCIRFELTEPIYYQYYYSFPANGPIVSSTYANGASISAGYLTLSPSGNYFEGGAQGDLDGNGIFSCFARGGAVNSATNQLVMATQLFIANEYE